MSRLSWVRTLRSSLAAVLCLAFVTIAGDASAQAAQVYLTYSPKDTGPPSGGAIALAPGPSTVPLHLWIAGGGPVSTTGPCQLTATGQEICGFDLVLDANGHFTFVDYSPDPGFDSGAGAVPILANRTPNRLALNGFDFGTPGTGNRYLGMVAVSVVGEPGQEDAMTVTGSVIGADLSIRDVPMRDVLLPEPGFVPLIALGGLGLAALPRRRRRAG